MFSINLVFIDRQTIQRLNKKYRQKDYTPAVLSFYYGEKDSPIAEIFVCPAEAKKQNLSIEELVTHGLKNLLPEIPTATFNRP